MTCRFFSSVFTFASAAFIIVLCAVVVFFLSDSTIRVPWTYGSVFNLFTS